MRRRSRTLWLVALVLTLGLGAIAQLRFGFLSAFVRGRARTPAASFSTIVVGKRLVFAVEADAAQSASGLSEVSGQLSVRARLELNLVRLDQAGGTASIRLVPERAMQFDVLGSKLLGASEATAVILGRVRWDGRGGLAQLELAEDANDVQAGLLAALLRQILVSNQCDRSATSVGVPLGLGIGRYALGAVDGAGRSRRLSTVTVALPFLGGDQEVAVRRADGRVGCQEGFPVSLSEDSDVAVLNSQGTELARLVNALHLRLLRIEVAHHDETRQLFREVNFGAGSPNRSLEQRARGLTGEEIVADLKRFANAGRMLDTPRWLWQATARLTLEPQHLPSLGELLRSEELVDTGRAFVTDLLAFTAAPEAQDVLRAALALPPPGVDATEHALLLQRFAFVPHPTPTTLAWLAAIRQNAPAGEPVWQATTLALGSAIGRLTFAHPEQTRYLDLLLGEIGVADAEEPLACRLRALGNTALVAPASVVRARASHASSLVRAAVASALRHQGDELSLGVLLTLAGDTAPFVQRHALFSLRPRLLTGSQYRALEVIFRHIPDSVMDDAVSFLAARRSLGLGPVELAAWRSLTAVLLPRARGNGPLEVRLAALLQP